MTVDRVAQAMVVEVRSREGELDPGEENGPAGWETRMAEMVAN